MLPPIPPPLFGTPAFTTLPDNLARLGYPKYTKREHPRIKGYYYGSPDTDPTPNWKLLVDILNDGKLPEGVHDIDTLTDWIAKTTGLPITKFAPGHGPVADEETTLRLLNFLAEKKATPSLASVAYELTSLPKTLECLGYPAHRLVEHAGKRYYHHKDRLNGGPLFLGRMKDEATPPKHFAMQKAIPARLAELGLQPKDFTTIETWPSASEEKTLQLINALLKEKAATMPLRTVPAAPTPKPVLLTEALAENKALQAQLAELRAANAKLQSDMDEAVSAPAQPPPELPAVPAATVRECDRGMVPAPDAGWTKTGLEGPLADLCRLGIPTILTGAPGTGKSEITREIAASLGRPYFRLACSDGLTENHAIGRRDVKDGQTTWSDGPIVNAAKYGWHLCLDELGAAQPAVLAVLHDLLATKRMHLPVTGEHITSDPSLWVTATSNWLASSRSDITHEQPISAPIVDRCAVLSVTFMSEETEKAIAAKRLGITYSTPDPEWTPTPTGLSRKWLDQATGFMSDLRAAEANHDLPGPYSRRRLTDLGKLWQAWGGTQAGQVMALRAAILDRHEPESRRAVCEIVQRRFGLRVA